MKTTIAIVYHPHYNSLLPRVLSDILMNVMLKEEAPEPYEIMIITVSYLRAGRPKAIEKLIESIVLRTSKTPISQQYLALTRTIPKYLKYEEEKQKHMMEVLSSIKTFFEKTNIKVEVSQKEIAEHTFSKIFSKIYETLREKAKESTKLYLNISCEDKATAIIFFMAASILARKYNNIELMPIRSEINPLVAFKIPLIPFDIKHRKTITKIIEILSEKKELNVSEIARLTQLSKSAISKVLPILEQHNFVKTEIKGREKVIKQGKLFEIARAILLE